jgi:heterodisulfide reductase subunit A-like polyferredoxin
MTPKDFVILVGAVSAPKTIVEVSRKAKLSAEGAANLVAIIVQHLRFQLGRLRL